MTILAFKKKETFVWNCNEPERPNCTVEREEIENPDILADDRVSVSFMSGE